MVLLIIICDGFSDLKTSIVLPFGLLFFNMRQCSSRRIYCKTLVIPLAFSETLSGHLFTVLRGEDLHKYSKCW